MSIRNLTVNNDTTIYCGDFDCKNMICENMTIPTGGDLDAHHITVEGDLKVLTKDGKDYVQYNTTDKGTAGYQLTTDGNGNTYWASNGGAGGVSNPLTANLQCANYDVVGANQLQSTYINTDAINVDVIATNNTQDININAIIGTLDMNGDAKAILKSSNEIDFFCNAGANTILTDNIFSNCNNYLVQATNNIDFASSGTIIFNGHIDYKGYFNDYNGGGIYNLNLINIDYLPNDPSYQGLKTNKISSALGNDINMDAKNYNNMGNIEFTSLSHPTGGLINCNLTTLNNIGNLQIDPNGVIDARALQNVENITSHLGTINMNNSILSNVSEIVGFDPIRTVTPGTVITFNGRFIVKIDTLSTNPVLLFSRQYNGSCSVYDGRFMSSNQTQAKIWCAPAVCVVNNITINKNIGGSGIASIGGTTRASNIDFNINAGYLECWITPNYSDFTYNTYECSIWSDL